MVVEARLLGATLGEGWPVMGELLAPVRPGLIILDGEEELSIMAAERWPNTPVQRCLFHLSNAVQHVSRYTDLIPLRDAKALRARFDRVLTDAHRSGEPPAHHPTSSAVSRSWLEAHVTTSPRYRGFLPHVSWSPRAFLLSWVTAPRHAAAR